MTDINEEPSNAGEQGIDNQADIPTSERFMGKFKWGILALGFIVLCFTLNFAIGQGAPLLEYLLLLAKHSLSLIIIPIVLAYIVWILLKGNKIASGIVYYLSIVATLGWIFTQEISSPDHIKAFGDFVKDRYMLQKEFNSAKAEDKDTAEVVEKIFLANSNYLSQMANLSDSSQKEFFQKLLTFISNQKKHSQKVSELEKVIFTDSFLSYPELREKSKVEEKLATLDEYLSGVTGLRQNNATFKEFFGKDKSEGIQMRRMEARLLFETVILPHADSANRLEGYYNACDQFATNIKNLVQWTGNNTDKWNYSIDETNQPAAITIQLDSPDTEKFFSALVSDTEESMKQLNAASEKVMMP